MSGKVFFVSGIDTGIGKTMATGLMARSLASAGRDVITVKLVQTGNDGFSEDIDAHRAICGGIRFPEDGEGLTAISRAVRECAARHEIVLVESAGGLDVPLTDELLSIDFAAREGWPLVLVSCGRLGSINHTLLSLEAAKTRGMSVAGVVWNWCEGADSRIDDDSCETTRSYLSRWGFPPVVVRIPRFDVGGPYPEVDFSEMFG